MTLLTLYLTDWLPYTLYSIFVVDWFSCIPGHTEKCCGICWTLSLPSYFCCG